MTKAVNKETLIAWLTERSAARSPLVASVYQGLADRVRRGDFDEEVER